MERFPVERFPVEDLDDQRRRIHYPPPFFEPRMDESLVFPFIRRIDGDVVFVQLNAFRVVSLVADCPCRSCIQTRECLDLTPLMQRWEQEVADRERERQRLIAARAEAEERAKALLISLLPEECAQSLAALNYFEFEGQHGRKYRLSFGYSGNVFSGGRSYCCYLLAPGLPTYDHMIGQYLALKYNEDLFLSTAY